MIAYSPEGHPTDREIDVRLFAFVFEGVTYTNPCCEPDGRTPCLPTRYGFEVMPTGGGCLAYYATGVSGEVMVTCDGVHLPELGDAAELIQIGVYDKNGDCLAIADLIEWGSIAASGWDGSNQDEDEE